MVSLRGLAVLGSAPMAAPALLPAFDPPGFDWETLFPLAWLGSQVGASVATNQWVQAMEALWAGALWMVQFAFKVVDAFTTPDLSEGGPMAQIYPATFAIGGALALVLAFVQIGFAAFQRSGQGLARLLLGVAQFGAAWAGMLGIGTLMTVATSGLTRGMLQLALGKPSFGDLNLVHPMTVRDGIDAAVATVLGVSGILLILAAIGYLAIMLVRAGALILIIATSPIAAAGLVAEGTRAWFWKALRWFLAALMMAPLSALIFAIGVKLTEGVVSGTGDTALPAAVGQAVIGTVLIIIGAFAPLVLFRLLAFVDPGTSSGQSFRASLDAAGGVAGLLGGKGADAEGGESSSGSGAATATSGDGSSSQGEADAATTTQGRVASAMGPLGSALKTGSAAAQGAAAFGADVLGAAGVGHPQPYFASPPASKNDNSSNNGNSKSQDKPPGDAEQRPGNDSGDNPGAGAGPSALPPAPTGDPYNMPPPGAGAGPVPGSPAPGGGVGGPSTSADATGGTAGGHNGASGGTGGRGSRGGPGAGGAGGGAGGVGALEGAGAAAL